MWNFLSSFLSFGLRGQAAVQRIAGFVPTAVPIRKCSRPRPELGVLACYRGGGIGRRHSGVRVWVPRYGGMLSAPLTPPPHANSPPVCHPSLCPFPKQTHRYSHIGMNNPSMVLIIDGLVYAVPLLPPTVVRSGFSPRGVSTLSGTHDRRVPLRSLPLPDDLAPELRPLASAPSLQSTT